jgi:ribose 5-phosphate isomerase B
MPGERVVIGGDHAGFALKEVLKAELAALGYAVDDVGTFDSASVDYPDIADKVAGKIAAGAPRGVLVCGTGIGIAIAANRHRGIRAAVCHDSVSARLARQHNDANVLALGARLLGEEVAKDCLRVFLSTAFEGGRHARRVAKMS